MGCLNFSLDFNNLLIYGNIHCCAGLRLNAMVEKQRTLTAGAQNVLRSW